MVVHFTLELTARCNGDSAGIAKPFCSMFHTFSWFLFHFSFSFVPDLFISWAFFYYYYFTIPFSSPWPL